MNVYQTDHAGVFVGVVEADESPLQPGVPLIPGGCVLDAPPAFAEGERARRDGGTWVIEPIPQPVSEPEEQPATRLAKADLWRRVTDAEAVALDTALAEAPARLRRLFEAATYLDAADADYPALSAGITAALGEERATQVLAPNY